MYTYSNNHEGDFTVFFNEGKEDESVIAICSDAEKADFVTKSCNILSSQLNTEPDNENDLIEALRFCRSVIKTQGMFDLSEQMAFDKATKALENIGAL